MNNNVYVRNNKSIFSISLIRIIFLLPLIAYGFYKNGIYLYQKGFVSIFGMFRPLVFVFGGAFIGALVNILYEVVIKKNKAGFIDILFSSFHIEYGIILGCLMPVSVNAIIFFLTTFVVLFTLRFANNRVNNICVTFIIIYVLSIIFNYFDYANYYELSRKFSFEFMDYMIGKAPGGIASTHIVLLLISLIGLLVTNNSKTTITWYSLMTIVTLFGAYAMISNTNFANLIFANNMFFIFTYVATDSVTSSYTKYGKKVFGFLIGLFTFGLYFINPILAPFIAILIVSLCNSLIDRKVSKLFHTKV